MIEGRHTIILSIEDGRTILELLDSIRGDIRYKWEGRYLRVFSELQRAVNYYDEKREGTD